MTEASKLIPKGILETWKEGTPPDPSAIELANTKTLQFSVVLGKYNPYHREGPPGPTWVLRIVDRKDDKEVSGIYLTAAGGYEPTPADFLTACRRSILSYLQYPTAKDYAIGEGLPYSSHYEVGEASFRFNSGLVLFRHLQKVLSPTGFNRFIGEVTSEDTPASTEQEGEPIVSKNKKTGVPAEQPKVSVRSSGPRPSSSIESLFTGL